MDEQRPQSPYLLLKIVLVVIFSAGCASVAPPPPRCTIEHPPPSDGRIGLDHSDRKHWAYFGQVRQRISANWVYPRTAGEQGIEGKADGRLEYVHLTQSSSTTILDNAALVAVKLAQPFPPVPDSVSSSGLRLRAAFCYQIVHGGMDHTLQ